MKNYTIFYDETMKINIDAKSANEAREIFLSGEYDSDPDPSGFEITNIDVIENKE